MWIKICAHTSLADAQLAADACADAIGFVFAASPRQVTVEQVAAVVAALPPDLTHVGVFQTRDFEEIVAAVRAAALHGIQLHGGLDVPLVDRLRAAFGDRMFLIQTLHWPLDQDSAQTEKNLRDDLRTLRRHGGADAVLLDAKTATAAGGTGKPIDWKRAQEAIAAEAGKMRIILAGGLTPENVAQAIQTVRPWGVDVASGVEKQPGRKDPARVRAFIEAARAAFAAIENHPLTAVTPR